MEREGSKLEQLELSSCACAKDGGGMGGSFGMQGGGLSTASAGLRVSARQVHRAPGTMSSSIARSLGKSGPVSFQAKSCSLLSLRFSSQLRPRSWTRGQWLQSLQGAAKAPSVTRPVLKAP